MAADVIKTTEVMTEIPTACPDCGNTQMWKTGSLAFLDDGTSRIVEGVTCPCGFKAHRVKPDD